ncbi:MAG: hypothetical protein JW776_05015 [Candidatus Lokiarchaeota archaeon]|nr:hypothetical protein [Candidatus Lokiarchaeota archaeon]
MTEKRRYFRILPLIGGLLGLLFTFMASIPLSSSYSLPLFVMESEGTLFYVWGIVDTNGIWHGFDQICLDNIVPFILWVLFLFISICGIFGTSYNSNPATIKKILLIGGFSAISIFVYFSIIFFLNFGLFILGFGYYGIFLIIAIYFLSAMLITDYKNE